MEKLRVTVGVLGIIGSVLVLFIGLYMLLTSEGYVRMHSWDVYSGEELRALLNNSKIQGILSIPFFIICVAATIFVTIRKGGRKANSNYLIICSMVNAGVVAIIWYRYPIFKLTSSGLFGLPVFIAGVLARYVNYEGKSDNSDGQKEIQRTVPSEKVLEEEEKMEISSKSNKKEESKVEYKRKIENDQESIESRLKEIRELFHKGLINQEEYKEKKAEILSLL